MSVSGSRRFPVDLGCFSGDFKQVRGISMKVLGGSNGSGVNLGQARQNTDVQSMPPPPMSRVTKTLSAAAPPHSLSTWVLKPDFGKCLFRYRPLTKSLQQYFKLFQHS